MRFIKVCSLAWELPVFFLLAVGSLSAQSGQQVAAKSETNAAAAPTERAVPKDEGSAIPSRADMLRGAYGPFRANNDLLYYHLDIRVDPDQECISGKNTIRFKHADRTARASRSI